MLQVRMILDLVNHGRMPRDGEDRLEVLPQEVGDADGADAPGVAQGFHLGPLGSEEGRVGGGEEGVVQEVEVDVVEAEGGEGAVQGCGDRGVLWGDRGFGGDEEGGTREGGARDGGAEFAFVGVGWGGGGGG